MSKSFYLHTPGPGLDDSVAAEQGFVIFGKHPDPEALQPMDLAIFTVHLARRLGVINRVPPQAGLLPGRAEGGGQHR